MALFFGSPGAALLVLLFGVFLVVYIKRVEEPELARRFGEEYLAYKQRTPFLIPRRQR